MAPERRYGSSSLQQWRRLSGAKTMRAKRTGKEVSWPLLAGLAADFFRPLASAPALIGIAQRAGLFRAQQRRPAAKGGRAHVIGRPRALVVLGRPGRLMVTCCSIQLRRWRQRRARLTTPPSQPASSAADDDDCNRLCRRRRRQVQLPNSAAKLYYICIASL